jgi:hypothetical protein
MKLAVPTPSQAATMYRPLGAMQIPSNPTRLGIQQVSSATIAYWRLVTSSSTPVCASCGRRKLLLTRQATVAVDAFSASLTLDDDWFNNILNTGFEGYADAPFEPIHGLSPSWPSIFDPSHREPDQISLDTTYCARLYNNRQKICSCQTI